jgi:hypothetical protein
MQGHWTLVLPKDWLTPTGRALLLLSPFIFSRKFPNYGLIPRMFSFFPKKETLHGSLNGRLFAVTTST